MDLPESTKVVFNRIQKLEPEHVSKILGYFLLQENCQHELIRLAFCPDNLLLSLINKVKADLGLNPVPTDSAPIPLPQMNHIPLQMNPSPLPELPLQYMPFSPSSSPASRQSINPLWEAHVTAEKQPVNNLEFMPPPPFSDFVANDFGLQSQLQSLSLDDQFDSVNMVGSELSTNYYYPDPALGPRTSRRSPSLPEFPIKVCHYFIKGFCKHGNNCRFFHGHAVPESLSQIINASSNELPNDDHAFSPRSLERLELELIELLKSRRGFPISIASLPMLYYEKYGKVLQAEGYLTESQRHGKTGYSLTKLLTRLNNGIRVIERPHGQHSVILAEDEAKYSELNGERNEHGGIVPGSRQIYLTFPAESTFSEQDVSNYFSKFGPVEDVRIPCQQKRMFGFVTFCYPETVRLILSKGNPHFVCGARVLVKPYREKSRLIDRKYAEKFQHPMYYGSHFVDAESELHAMPRIFENPRMLRKQVMEEQRLAHELQRKQLLELQLANKPVNSDQFPEVHAEQFKHLFNALNNGTTTDDKIIEVNTKKVAEINTKYGGQESNHGSNLPDSPFGPAIGNQHFNSSVNS
ncbi:hypothetical protein NMG60_11035315 [Bertholletia excelsa]